MQTQLPQVRLPQPPMAAPVARPQVTIPQQQPVMFGSKVKFGNNGGQAPGLFARFVRLIKAMLGLKMDNLERENAEAVLNQTQNEVAQATKNEIARLSRVVGRPAVIKAELEEMIAAHKREQEEAEDAADLMLKKMTELQCDENDKRLDAYKKAMLKEEGDAQRALDAMTAKEEEYKGAVTDAEEAQGEIERLNEELTETIERLEKGKQDAAAVKGLEERREMKRLLDEAKGKTQGLSSSAGKMMRDLALAKEGLKAELRGGATEEEASATRQVQKELKEAKQNKRVSDLLAKRRAAQAGQAAGEQQAAAGGDNDVKPGS